METLFVVLSCIIIPMIPALAAMWETRDAVSEDESYDYR